MGAATSKDMALAVLVPLPLNLLSMVARFWIRTQRKAWGPDDWAMVATIVSLLILRPSFCRPGSVISCVFLFANTTKSLYGRFPRLE